MLLKNNNNYNIMFDMDFIKAGEIKEIKDEQVAKFLLSQPGIEEHIDKKQAKALEEENAKLKEELKEAKEEIKKEVKKEVKPKAKAKK